MDSLASFKNSLMQHEEQLYEENARAFSTHLKALLTLQDALYSILGQEENILLPDSDPLDKFVYQTTVRVLSLSHLTANTVLKGFPFDGLGLLRLMHEFLRVTLYILELPHELPPYLDGKLGVTSHILPEELKIWGEDKKTSPRHFTWVTLSTYSHATPEHLKIFAESDYEFKRIPFLVNQKVTVKNALSEIAAVLHSQYWIFRVRLKGMLFIPESVKEADKKIFLDPEFKMVFYEQMNETSEQIYNVIYS